MIKILIKFILKLFFSMLFLFFFSTKFIFKKEKIKNNNFNLKNINQYYSYYKNKFFNKKSNFNSYYLNNKKKK